MKMTVVSFTVLFGLFTGYHSNIQKPVDQRAFSNAAPMSFTQAFEYARAHNLIDSSDVEDRRYGYTPSFSSWVFDERVSFSNWMKDVKATIDMYHKK